MGDYIKLLTGFIVILLLSFGCTNPFAPALDRSPSTGDGIISDQKNIDGVFKNLQYAYAFKDTLIYSGLLNEKFNFTYRDYDLGADISWGKEEEMKVTYGLFQNSQRLDLIWNNIVTITEDSTRIIRGFNLTITFNPTDIIYIDGKVNLELKKRDSKWEILRWIDESNF